MLPYGHILFGAIFTVLIWIAVPQISYIFLALIFFSSFLIDFDHYLCSVIKTRRLGLFHAFKYNQELIMGEKRKQRLGIREKSDFHFFHTIEFHVFIGLLGFVWIGFFYIFLGMIFHSLIDIASLLREDKVYAREFFFTNWLYRKLKKIKK